MANDDRNVPRTLHLKVTLPTADAAQLLSLVQAATPFVELFGGKTWLRRKSWLSSILFSG